MDVVGVFVFSTESAFKNSSAILWQVSSYCISHLDKFFSVGKHGKKQQHAVGRNHVFVF